MAYVNSRRFADEIRDLYGFTVLTWKRDGRLYLFTIRCREQDVMIIMAADHFERAADPADILWSRFDHVCWRFTGSWPHRAECMALYHLLPPEFQSQDYRHLLRRV